jgi:predicted porin
MKKSLLALALLGAFTASAFAEPSVTLYGRIDTGLVYTHKNLDNTAGSTDTFSMDSGVTTGSRWGLKTSATRRLASSSNPASILMTAPPARITVSSAVKLR